MMSEAQSGTVEPARTCPLDRCSLLFAVLTSPSSRSARVEDNAPQASHTVLDKNASWAEMEGHYENEHPAATSKLLSMSPEQIREAVQRFQLPRNLKRSSTS